MKSVIYQDAYGLKHRRLLPEHLPDSAVETGIPLDPPPFLEMLDWEGMGRSVWNEMVEHGLVDWESHQSSPALLPAIIKSQVMNPIINLLKAETRNRIIAPVNGTGHQNKEKKK